MKNYTQTTTAKSNVEKAFSAITKEIDKWWGNVSARVEKTGDQFTITFGNAFWTFEITEFVPYEKIIWVCIDGQPELNNEWIGHQLQWTITPLENETVGITLLQEGLTESLPCYGICSLAWDRFILLSLTQYLETGVGNPG